jgi:hypothetical protein
MSNSLMLKISAVAVATGAAVMQMPSAEAQNVAVPVSGGGFVVRYDTTPWGSNEYVTTPTFVTPVGTIAVTDTPNLPVWQGGIEINLTDTPIGVNIDNINGSVSLNDGRNAALVNSSAFLQALAKVTVGAVPVSPSKPPFGITEITANFRSGSINVPQSAFSPLPSPQVVIPITNGTFTLNIPDNQAAFPVITFNSVITPLGTANLTFTFPASVPCECGTFIPIASPADISVVVNGTIALNDGRTANINNRLVTFQANARVSDPIFTPYAVADVPEVPFTVLGDFSNFNISIPASDVATPAFQLTQSANPNLANTLIIPDLDDSPLSKRRF